MPQLLDPTQDNSYRTGFIASVRTMHRQTIRVDDQVAYVTPVSLSVVGDTVRANGGRLQVSGVEQIEKETCGFAEADPVVKLHLANGDVIDCSDVVKTDGSFSEP